ncbi:tRNA uridine-5-carboxymethylaminomethyl(34) synthesis GTPase MnmE [Methylocapsa sp. S129]|uniref:tRNA uridine-5-carboxymethylaminomethyl(34) synthesis GTPase MnmE n=1 Tax=Methylocapsa sp. S129 TaxID=1641869 RepID=UPI001FF045D4|nr:tRNA uridine-5-carboxymethylaminomethyl(34) synthesis GTPase MnmE [Methylocapsa sp. S129]
MFAPASGVGRAAISVIRLSGSACDNALRALIRGPLPAERVVSLKTLRHPVTDEELDRALVIRFAAPRSYTGEDMAELHVTGGRAVLAGVIEALALLADMRPADPGEFALRAFENGKLDLSQVEGLADLVDAQTQAQRRQALRIAGGALTRESEAIRALIVEATAQIEAQIDFSDQEDVDVLGIHHVRDLVDEAAARIGRTLASAQSGERLRDGFNVVIAGPPNVGKSTLMNAIARRDVSIVSATPGTTRDPIEIQLDLRGFPVNLVDTAGIRDTEDPIEKEGVLRARRRADEADLTLWLTEGGRAEAPFPKEDGRPVLQVRTKIDLGEAESPSGSIAVSAKTGQGIDRLLDAVADVAEELLSGQGPALIALTRHRLAFEEALAHLERLRAPQNAALEFIAEDLRLAARALERIAGRIDVEEVLGAIFSRLCIGK